jgi:glycosyltransferase involved in cell wall biosynthesis
MIPGNSEMRWLVLASSLDSKNGYGVLCGSVLQALGKIQGSQWDILTAGRRGSWWSGRNSLKSEWISSYPRLWFLIAAFDFLQLLAFARGRYDGVFVMVEHYAAAGWLFARLKRLPFVLVQHGTYALELPRTIPFFRRIIRDAERVMPVSRYTRERMEREGLHARFSVVNPGVDLRAFQPVPGIARKREVVFVGNLKPRKGLGFLLESLALACRTDPGIRLKVVGKVDQDSPAFAEIAAKIRQFGLEVEFTGAISHAELLRIYSQARLNALPSKSEGDHFEGFGLIHLEANACGTLTVGTQGSGNEDAIQDGSGYLLRYGDVPALARSILEAMSAEPYPSPHADRIRTWDDAARDYASILRETLRLSPRGERTSGGHVVELPEPSR